MNLVGEIGNFIMIYQKPIQAAAIAFLLIGGMVYIGNTILYAKKKRKWMDRLKQTVSEIDININYLDDTETDACVVDDQNTPEKDTPELKASESLEEDVKPAVKYFSRDCAVAKDGRQYTLEELHAQIRD